MPMRSASSTCVSFRWRRSWRILRPTSSSCAGLFMAFSLTFMLWENKLRPLKSTGLYPLLSSPEASHVPKCSSLTRAREARFCCPLHGFGPRPVLGRAPAAVVGGGLLVRFYLHVHARTVSQRRQLHPFPHFGPAARAGHQPGRGAV